MDAVLSRAAIRQLATDARASSESVVLTALTIAAFVGLFFEPLTTVALDWWTEPDAGHGLLLAPVAVWFAWRKGFVANSRSSTGLGLLLVVAAVLLRYAAGLAAEPFTMRMSVLLALVGITAFYRGLPQVLHWWLPFTLAFLSVPLPQLVTQQLALPLQLQASQMGAALLRARDIPVQLAGNVIRLPGHELFVTEACSGLRSLTALASVSILIGALFLRTVTGRAALMLVIVPVALLVNGLRVFLTGFLVYFVDPKLGTGFLHLTEGWLLFLVSLAGVALFALGLRATERLRWSRIS